MTTDSDMPTGNILEAKEKFDKLFQELQTKKSNIEAELLMINEKISDLAAQRTNQIDTLENLNDEYYKHRAHSEDALQLLKIKLDATNQERMRLETREAHVIDQKEQAEHENLRLKEIQREKETKDQIRSDLLKDEMDKVQNDIVSKDAVLEDLRIKKIEYDYVISSDLRFANIKETHNKLIKDINDKELENNSLNYKSFELDNLQKLALKQKEIDGEERRRLNEEYDRLEKICSDTLKMNELRIERMIKENEPEQIKQMKAKLKIEEIQIEDAKDKWSNVNLIYTKFKTDLNHRVAESTDTTTKIAVVKAEIEKYDNEIASIEPDAKTYKGKCDDLQKIIDAKIDEKRKHLDSNQNNKKILEGLKAKYSYINDNFDLQRELSNINLEELKHVMNNNSNVNNTIAQLLGRWNNIQDFSTDHLN